MSPDSTAATERWRPSSLVITTLVLLQFLIWSNSFVAVAFLLGSEGAEARLDWVSLTIARFGLTGAISLAYCAVFQRVESFELLRRSWRRLLVCAALAVPGYNFGLYYGQQHGVSASVASLVTALLPLIVMIQSVLFLGERATLPRVVGFVVAIAGMYLVASARGDLTVDGYPLLVAITALAPFCWATYTVLSKRLVEVYSPIVWAALLNIAGSLMVLPLLPGRSWERIAALDASGWLAVLYLVIPCTVIGYALWTWLLRYLPASAVGFTVFLNPPMTAVSKFLLSAAFPAAFTFVLMPREWIGGAVTLLGMGIALGLMTRRGSGRGAATRRRRLARPR